MPESHGYYGGAKAGETLVQRLSRQAGQAIEDSANAAGRYISKRLDTQLYPEDVQQFQSAPPPEYTLFLEATWQAMGMPVVKIGDRVVTPDEYLTMAAAKSNLPESAVNTAKQSLAGMPVDESDEAGIALRDALLGQLRDNLPGRNAESGWDTGANPEQVAEFAKDGPRESRYRLTPEGEQGYQSERVYNLFSTFQNGEFAPVWSDVGSKVLGVLGAPFDMRAGIPGATPYLAASRFNTPTGRLAESMYWWKQGEPNGTAATSAGGAKYPSISSTTLEGVTTKLDSTDNYIPYYNQQLPERYLYNLDLEAGDRSQLQQMRDDLFRITPRYPAGADPKEMRQLIRDLRDFDQKARGFANAEYPEFVRKYTIPVEAWTSGGHDWMGRPSTSRPRKPVEATYLSPFGEMMANYPRDAVDLQTVLTLGVGALKGSPSLLGGLMDASKSGTKAVARRAAVSAAGAIRRTVDNTLDDLAQEIPTNTAMQAANQPGPTQSTPSAFSSFFTPMETSIVTDEQGKPVKANDPNYRKYLDDTYQRRQGELRGLLDRGTTLYDRQSLAK
jgi:hypothetical protein